MRISRMALLLPLALTSYACTKVECETPRDCLDPLTCVDNKCVQDQGGPGGGDDGGDSDFGARADGGDAMIDDRGEVELDGSEADGGDAGDAMIPMRPDGGRLSHDSGTDAGMPAMITRLSGGRIDYAELVSTMDEAIELGEFYDRSMATYAFLEQRYPDIYGNDCTVTTTRLAGGQEIGYGADHLEIERPGNPGIVRILSPVAGIQGRFEGKEPLEGRLFTQPGDIQAEVISANVAGSLDDAITVVGRPISVEGIMPFPGTPLALVANNPMFMYPTAPSASPLVFEAHDAYGEVVLRCEVPSTIGQYIIPYPAVLAFYGEGPAVPVYLDVTHQLDIDIMVGVVGAPVQVPTKVRTARGVRYPLQ